MVVRTDVHADPPDGAGHSPKRGSQRPLIAFQPLSVIVLGLNRWFIIVLGLSNRSGINPEVENHAGLDRLSVADRALRPDRDPSATDRDGYRLHSGDRQRWHDRAAYGAGAAAPRADSRRTPELRAQARRRAPGG